jgi:DNA-binding NarL/FixJ family response regulator
MRTGKEAAKAAIFARRRTRYRANREKVVVVMIKALIVEDHDDFRSFLKALLYRKYPDCMFAEASTAAEAMRKLTLFRPQLVFIDINLAGSMNGLMLTEAIHNHDASIEIIVITNHDLPEYRAASVHHGAQFFLPKGSSSGADILAAVATAIARHPEPRAD